MPDAAGRGVNAGGCGGTSTSDGRIGAGSTAVGSVTPNEAK
jgi:hypothetical protein